MEMERNRAAKLMALKKQLSSSDLWDTEQVRNISMQDNVPLCEKLPSHPQSQTQYFVFLSDKDFTVKAVPIFKDPSMCVGFFALDSTI